MSKSALLVSTAVGLTLAIAGPAAALNRPQHPGKPKDPYRLQHVPGAPAKPQRDSRPAAAGLKETYVVDKWGSSGSLFGGFSVIDTTALPCKKACTIITDTVATFASYYSYNQVALCPAVDGYFTNGSCMSFGIGPGGQHIVPQLTNISLGAGAHQADFYVYTVAPAYIGGFQIDYHVYR